MFKKLLLLLSLIALVDGNSIPPCGVDSALWNTQQYCDGPERTPCAETCADVKSLLLNISSSNCTAQWALVGNTITTTRNLSPVEINAWGFNSTTFLCNGNMGSWVDCAGTPNGPLVNDPCSVCGGDGSSCADCAGTPNGLAVNDTCGVCDGDNSTCAGCDGVANSGLVNDACSVCGGDDSSCADCAGTPNGLAVNDTCGVCDGDNSTCAGCDGVANSGLVNDACSVCGGNNSTCAGCDGVANSGLVNDACGACGGDGSSCDNALRNWIILIVGACIVLAACLYCGWQRKNSSEDERVSLLSRVDRVESRMESQVKSLKF